MGRGTLNYNLILAGNGSDIADFTIGVFYREEWQRPQLGQEIEYNSRIYRVIKTDPRDNPADKAVTYWLEPLNPNRPYKPTRKGKEPRVKTEASK